MWLGHLSINLLTDFTGFNSEETKKYFHKIFVENSQLGQKSQKNEISV